MKSIRKFLGSEPPPLPPPEIPAGQRVYAVGDIHGRLDLFEALVTAIEDDDAQSGAAETTVILLGDLVDRGPDSAGVIAAARQWQARREVRIIVGNHEEMFLEAFANQDVLRQFLRHGGRETLLSYPIDPAAYAAADLPELQALMAAAVPQEDRDYLGTFERGITIGDYFFTHAGIEPGIPIDNQSARTLRWIREPFLSHKGYHGAIVVHGHSIAEEVEVRSNRIGINTGGYIHGVLTALCVEGTSQRLLQACDVEGAISIVRRTIA